MQQRKPRTPSLMWFLHVHEHVCAEAALYGCMHIHAQSLLLKCTDCTLLRCRCMTCNTMPKLSSFQMSLPCMQCVVVYLLYVCYLALNSTRKVGGVLLNAYWPSVGFGICGLVGGAFMLAYVAACYRSRRMLLGAQVALTVLYAASMSMTSFAMFKPTVVDAKVGEYSTQGHAIVVGPQDMSAAWLRAWTCPALSVLCCMLVITSGSMRPPRVSKGVGP